MELEERFWSKVDWDIHEPDRCWEWLAFRNERGYGKFQLETTRSVGAHLVAYDLEVGPVPDGMELDHLCRNRACVNPDHLEPVTHRVNTLRGANFAAVNARKSICPKGHPYNETLARGSGTRARSCSICRKRVQRESARRRYWARKEGKDVFDE